MTLPKRLPPVAAFVVGAALFAALSAGTPLLASWLDAQGPVARQIILKGAMVAVSAALILLIARPRRVWGAGAPRTWVSGVILPTVVGTLLGGATTAVILLCRFAPMAGIREMGLLNMVGVIWIGSTFAEELFTRGLIQGWMQPRDAGEAGGVPERPVEGGAGARILASGWLFGAMHLSLFVVGGNDVRTAATIVVATTLLGLTCAWSRERCGSLAGPLLAHFAFNVAGVVGGAVVVIVGRMAGVDLLPA